MTSSKAQFVHIVRVKTKDRDVILLKRVLQSLC